VKENRSAIAANQPPEGDEQIDWAKAYERRMRRFNMEVVLAALIALVLVIASLFFL
jgi:hypothetical protein